MKLRTLALAVIPTLCVCGVLWAQSTIGSGSGYGIVTARNGRLVVLSGDLTLDDTYDGASIVHNDNSADHTVTVPTTLRSGFKVAFVCNSTAKKLTIQLSGTERYRTGGDLTGAGGSMVFDGAGGGNTGYMLNMQKVSDGFAFTTWQNMGAVGAPTLN